MTGTESYGPVERVEVGPESAAWVKAPEEPDTERTTATRTRKAVFSRTPPTSSQSRTSRSTESPER
jgi:hypothetical protein